MLTNERCYEIDDYIHQLIYHNGENITEEMKPKNSEEQAYFNKHYQWELEDKQKTENFYKNLELAKDEAEQVARKYLPKEYWSDGYFSSDEFKNILNDIEEKILDEVNNLKVFDPRYYFLTLGGHHFSSPQFWAYENLRTKQILKRKYKINWNPKKDYYTDEYIKEINDIEEKYNVPLSSYR